MKAPSHAVKSTNNDQVTGDAPNYLDGGMWLDGPRLFAWLRGRGVDRLKLEQTHRWALESMGRGRCFSVWTADKLLTRLDLHLTEVPDDVWIESSSRRPLPAEKWEEVLARYAAGDALAGIAVEYGISRETIATKASERGVKRPRKVFDVDALIDRSGGADACWPWSGRMSESGIPLGPTGHSILRVIVKRERRLKRTERVFRTCRSRTCCNPAHFKVGGARMAQNMGRAWASA